jgi:circadian clock protein KaiC
MRFFEAQGAVRQAISVVKKRTGEHEHTIREFQITSQGPRVGAPIANFQGVMTGVPQFTGPGERLFSTKDARRRPRTHSR